MCCTEKINKARNFILCGHSPSFLFDNSRGNLFLRRSKHPARHHFLPNQSFHFKEIEEKNNSGKYSVVLSNSIPVPHTMVDPEGFDPAMRNQFENRRTSFGLQSRRFESVSTIGSGFHSLTMTCLAIFLCLLMVPGSQAIRFLGEPGTYAKYPMWDACDNATIMFDFKTTQPNALLMYTDDSGRYDYLQVSTDIV